MDQELYDLIKRDGVKRIVKYTYIPKVGEPDKSGEEFLAASMNSSSIWLEPVKTIEELWEIKLENPREFRHVYVEELDVPVLWDPIGQCWAILDDVENS